MSDATAAFFHSLDRRGPEPLLGNARGTVCFELVNGTHTDRWLVAFDKGRRRVSKKRSRPIAPSARTRRCSKGSSTDR